MVKTLDPEVVVDIGANEGQFVRSLRAHGWAGRAISVEPGTAAHAALMEAAAIDPHWTVADRVAVGRVEGQVEFFVSANSVSSSVRRMLAKHERAAPDSRVVRSERVTVSTLDRLVSAHAPNSRVFLKIDTQGAELDVLAGATVTLKDCVGVACEVSLVPLYQGAPSWEEVLEVLRAAGLRIWGIEAGFSDPVTGEVYQCDLLMCRG